jgi:cytochrome c556
MRLVAFAAAAALSIATAVAAQPRAAATIHARQANYKQMGAAMKAINDELHGSNPSLAGLRTRTRVIAGFAPQLLRWFPHGTGPEAGVRTRALPAIWSNHRGFTRAGAVLVVAARELDGAARRGDLAAVRAALPRVRGACSGCHDDFRSEEE